jgi:hypothetical protein
VENNQFKYLQGILSRLQQEHDCNLTFEETKAAGWTFFNTIEQGSRNTELISDTVYTGFNRSPVTAFSKSICEYIERSAFRMGFHRNDINCMTDRSDGFAAYPNFPDIETARIRARENALNEAIERYVWATWWDNNSHAIVADLKSTLSQMFEPLFNVISEYTPIEKIIHIIPSFERRSSNFEKLQINILFLKIKGAGYISAGSVGPTDQSELNFERALAELIRHSIATARWLKDNKMPSSFYEKRLCYFASGKGNALVEARLNSTNIEIIKIPELSIDTIIPHKYEDLVTVHRCLFEGQPPFIGGALERLCL